MPGGPGSNRLPLGGRHDRAEAGSNSQTQVITEEDSVVPPWSVPGGGAAVSASARLEATDGDAGAAAIAEAWDIGIKKYIADTGCGIHLIPKSIVKSRRLLQYMKTLEDPIGLDTAAGGTECKNTLAIGFKPLANEVLVAHVLDDTPLLEGCV